MDKAQIIVTGASQGIEVAIATELDGRATGSR